MTNQYVELLVFIQKKYYLCTFPLHKLNGCISDSWLLQGGLSDLPRFRDCHLCNTFGQLPTCILVPYYFRERFEYKVSKFLLKSHSLLTEIILKDCVLTYFNPPEDFLSRYIFNFSLTIWYFRNKCLTLQSVFYYRPSIINYASP